MKEESGVEDLRKLQDRWKEMFQQKLPAAAVSKSPAQTKWPVHVDHCFARIILDKVVGEGEEPWIGKVKTPAYKNMTKVQLQRSIDLGEQILNGKVDLVVLDESSLISRGKTGKGKGKDRGEKLERQRRTAEISKYFPKSDTGKRKQEPVTGDDHATSTTKKMRITGHQETLLQSEIPKSETTSNTGGAVDIPFFLKKIQLSDKTPFQKRVLTALCQVPPGSYTTYGAMAHHLDSSARAVGNALKNNPFAPEVPCHRVLATGGGLGGFGGSWGRKGEAGKNDQKKLRLLRDEGVKFDGKSKVVGAVWDGFV